MDFFLSLLCAAIPVFAVVFGSRRRSRRLPPGPKGLPFFGNIFDIPAKHEWLQYAKWCHEYSRYPSGRQSCPLSDRVLLDSDMISLNFVGTPVVVVNTQDIAMDLFEKRSSIYSDRYAHSCTMNIALIGGCQG